MPGSERVRKAASLFTIALVLGASAWLRPAATPPFLAARVAFHAAQPGIAVQSPVQSRFRVHPESVQSRFRVHPESVQSRFRVHSESVQSRFGVDSEPELQELRTPPALAGLDTVPAPGIRAATPRGPAAGAHLSRAFATAGRETSGAFRTAARALRSVF